MVSGRTEVRRSRRTSVRPEETSVDVLQEDPRALRAYRPRSPACEACRAPVRPDVVEVADPAAPRCVLPRRLVVSSIATIGNYEYGFYWYFYLDGTLQLEVKLTGIMSTMAVADGDAGGGTPRSVAPRAGGSVPHQHMFNVRLDIEIDGPDNAVYEVDTVSSGAPGAPENPWGNVFGTTATLLESELAARRGVDPSRSRTWRIANRSPQQRRRRGHGVQAAAGVDAHVARPPGIERWGGAPRSPRTTCGSRRSTPRSGGPPATTRTSTAAAPACPSGRRRTARRRHRRRAVAHVRRHAHPAARGLAGNARRVHRLHPGPVRLLRPQPHARRPALGRPLRAGHDQD